MRPRNDREIYAHCDARPADPRCRCLRADASVLRAGRDLLLPYYCWYEPCLRRDALLPAALRAGIARCNVTDCKVSLGDIALRGGALAVSNACLSSSVRAERTRVRYLNQRLLPPVLPPRALLLAFCALALLVAIRARRPPRGPRSPRP
ncbi:myristylprotein of the poxvirus entry/fusion-complex [Equine molluscum contagiosum-like virus]|nr:myristylprotein of the poxvirus entry/fusion-complex [Equine molluscum contagiosum-like virus]